MDLRGRETAAVATESRRACDRFARQGPSLGVRAQGEETLQQERWKVQKKLGKGNWKVFLRVKLFLMLGKHSCKTLEGQKEEE